MTVSHNLANCGKLSTSFFIVSLLLHFRQLYLYHHYLTLLHLSLPTKSPNSTLHLLPTPASFVHPTLIHQIHPQLLTLFVGSVMMKLSNLFSNHRTNNATWIQYPPLCSNGVLTFSVRCPSRLCLRHHLVHSLHNPIELIN